MAIHHATARYESWVQHQRALDERVPQYWSVATSVQQLLLKLGNREVDEFKKRKVAVLRSRKSPDAIVDVGQQAVHTYRPSAQNQPGVINAVENINFSISEFASLCIIIRDDEDAEAALFASGQELTRSQVDAGFSRESFWGVIECRFNDAGLRLCLRMMGNVDEVDSTQPPPCHRSASFLKEIFFHVPRLHCLLKTGQNLGKTKLPTLSPSRALAAESSQQRESATWCYLHARGWVQKMKTTVFGACVCSQYGTVEVLTKEDQQPHWEENPLLKLLRQLGHAGVLGETRRRE